MAPLAAPGVSSSTAEWERQLGSSVRSVRLERNMTQLELARLANIDRTTVSAIERGEGGSISSLVKIARALQQERWLASFAPPVSAVSPMALLEAQTRARHQPRQRARRSTRSTETE